MSLGHFSSHTDNISLYLTCSYHINTTNLRPLIIYTKLFNWKTKGNMWSFEHKPLLLPSFDKQSYAFPIARNSKNLDST